ncbi:hypothetical protein BURMUCGD2_3862 [Burkholderia multivorans CGD2]|uniref:Uncharacterized protein n=1 Tax=Burkholderia multivorans CGD2 TaxID=513052 RepID=B9BUX2_9BURK|nr:hypothetical protein BURMUCGD2_3862 [Burkholderia multivorans CGD2]
MAMYEKPWSAVWSNRSATGKMIANNRNSSIHCRPHGKP